MSRVIGALSFLWLLMAIAVAQESVLDADGQPLQAGIEYYVLPSITDSGGRLTLIDRNGSCPLYVGQADLVSSPAFPVIFTPFVAGDTIIRVNRDFTVHFSASTTCVQSTAWRVGQTDTVTERRLILTGSGGGRYDQYFRMESDGNLYKLTWCPTDVCPICRFICGSAGGLVENGKRLLALDGPVLPVMFKRA